MIKETTYWPDWQKNRIKFILSKYPKDFFKGKTILELGAYNGYIGAYFNSLGAIVNCVEGRPEYVENIKRDYPQIKVDNADLDTPNWAWGSYDIIINFGLFYHLDKYHKEHLNNCIKNCDLMFFESVIFDSDESEIYFRYEHGGTQSLSDRGGSPSTKFVEDIFTENKVAFTKYSLRELNGHEHHYDWQDKNTKILDQFARNFWIINKKNEI